MARIQDDQGGAVAQGGPGPRRGGHHHHRRRLGRGRRIGWQGGQRPNPAGGRHHGGAHRRQPRRRRLRQDTEGPFPGVRDASRGRRRAGADHGRQQAAQVAVGQVQHQTGRVAVTGGQEIGAGHAHRPVRLQHHLGGAGQAAGHAHGLHQAAAIARQGRLPGHRRQVDDHLRGADGGGNVIIRALAHLQDEARLVTLQAQARGQHGAALGCRGHAQRLGLGHVYGAQAAGGHNGWKKEAKQAEDGRQGRRRDRPPRPPVPQEQTLSTPKGGQDGLPRNQAGRAFIFGLIPPLNQSVQA